jgi:hypothetical protein
MIITRFEYMKGLKCRKLLWTLFNEPEKIPCNYDGTQGLFYDEGAVTELVQSLFPDIILAEQENVNSEENGIPWFLLAKRRPIFRASFTSAGISAKIDVLKPADDDKWDIVQFNTDSLDTENTNSSITKHYRRRHEQHVRDISFQCHCCEKVGVIIRNCYLTHVNPNYVRRGAINAHELLTLEDVTDNVRAESAGIEPRIAEMQRVIEMKECPAFEMFTKETRCLSICHLTHCHCPLIEQCREATNGKSAMLPPISDTDYDVEKIRNFMGRLVYPIRILDLNYFTRAIPLDGCKPYKMLPFVVSLQELENLDSDPVSHFWLWDGNGDPRSLALHRIKELIGGSGSIIIRFKQFHEKYLKKFATAFPEHQPLLENMMSRMLELIEPFNQKILGVLALNGVDLFEAAFPDMECSDSYMDSIEFIKCIYGKQSADEYERIRIRLENNCRRNTMQILVILRRLAGFSRKGDALKEIN